MQTEKRAHSLHWRVAAADLDAACALLEAVWAGPVRTRAPLYVQDPELLELLDPSADLGDARVYLRRLSELVTDEADQASRAGFARSLASAARRCEREGYGPTPENLLAFMYERFSERDSAPGVFDDWLDLPLMTAATLHQWMLQAAGKRRGVVLLEIVEQVGGTVAARVVLPRGQVPPLAQPLDTPVAQDLARSEALEEALLTLCVPGPGVKPAARSREERVEVARQLGAALETRGYEVTGVPPSLSEEQPDFEVALTLWKGGEPRAAVGVTPGAQVVGWITGVPDPVISADLQAALEEVTHE